MEAGAYLHRRGVGLHAFDVSGAVSLAAAYLEPEGGDYRYRYAVLCGGEAAKRALRTAVLDPTDSGDPGLGRRIVLAPYADYSDFIERLPAYLADITRTIEGRVQQTAGAEAQIRRARRRVSSATGRADRRRALSRAPAGGSSGRRIGTRRASHGSCRRTSSRQPCEPSSARMARITRLSTTYWRSAPGAAQTRRRRTRSSRTTSLRSGDCWRWSKSCRTRPEPASRPPAASPLSQSAR